MSGAEPQAGRKRHRAGHCQGVAAGSARCAVGVLIAAWVGAGSAGCRLDQPRRNAIRPLQLTDIGGHLEFVARDRRRRQESKVGAGDTRSEETIFEENVKLEFDGYTYHPNFLEFTVAGLFGLLQHDFEDVFDGRQRRSSDEGTVVEFDLTGHFFKKKKYPGTVFARRYRAIEPRPFQPSLETTTTNFGLVWQYVSEKTPTSIQFNHTDILLDPLGGEEETGRQRNTSLRFETSYKISDHNAFSFLYNRLSVKEEPFELNYDSDEATLSHRLGFGDRHQHRLESELNYFDQRGTFEVTRVRWREVLHLEHSETLRSRYQGEVIDRTQGSLAGVEPIEERSYFLSGLLEHDLYESLVSQLLGFAQIQRFAGGLDIDRFGIQANFDYRKRNPWGVLVANYRARFDREDRRGGDQRIEVLDERHTFRDPEPVTLANPNVDISTIQMTAEDRVTFFVAGRDFTVRRVGDRVEIDRVSTGRILDEQTVLVDYLFDVGGTFTLDTVSHHVAIRQNFDFGLSPYYRLRWQEQTVSPATATGVVPEDIRAHIVGLEFRRWSFRLVAEFEDHDSTVTPFEAVRLSADYTHRFKFGATGAVKARWSDVTYQPPVARETTFFTIEGRYRHPLTEHLTVEGAVLFRTEEDSLSGDEDGVEVDLSLEWRIRQTEVRVTYEFGEFEDDFSRNEHSLLYVQVRRRF